MPSSLPSTLAALLLAASTASAAITIPTVSVGDAGNAADPTTKNDYTGEVYGDVAYEYRIGKYEITNSQYTEFLNAVAAKDTHSLYNTDMNSLHGGITRTGSDGTYVYSVKSGFAEKPVNFVSFWDAARFANWLTNGQPTGSQDNSTTEDGAYTLTADRINQNTVTRGSWYDASAGNITSNNPVFAVASQDEWYKAAYYDPTLNNGNGGYYKYPTENDTAPTAEPPPGGENSANYDNAVDGGSLTEVGAYPGSGSHYGTFDQGGNVWEWNDQAISYVDWEGRGLRGGYFCCIFGMPSSDRSGREHQIEDATNGFRITSLAPIGPTFFFQSQSGIGGTVSPNDAAYYQAETEITVTATPNAGYVFDSWSGSVSATDPQITISLDQDHDITATFIQDQSDPDSDGLTNYEEATHGSNPNVADTSGDGLSDGVVANAGFDPTTNFSALISGGSLAVDSNGNGLTDSFESTPTPATLNNLGYYTQQSLTDGRPGSITISADNQGGVTLELQIQRSDDLVEWSSDLADRIQIPLTLSGDKEFFRFAIPE